MAARLFITGIGTGVGKTICSAVAVQALQADYWKPIQAGELEASDSMMVRLLAPQGGTIHPEAFRLRRPMSPHAAAEHDGLRIETGACVPPETDRILIIEGAGGVLVPLNETELMADLIRRLRAAAVVVSQSYLGSINHTLLTLEALQTRGIPVAGIIFNGERVQSSESYIARRSALPVIGSIPWLGSMGRDTAEARTISAETVARTAKELRDNLAAAAVRARDLTASMESGG